MLSGARFFFLFFFPAAKKNKPNNLKTPFHSDCPTPLCLIITLLIDASDFPWACVCMHVCLTQPLVVEVKNVLLRGRASIRVSFGKHRKEFPRIDPVG